ncbi:MAG: D-alanine--D-alanine ligase [Kiritimatiellia bacterium]
MAKKFRNVVVLMGGTSNESKVSQISGSAVAKGLMEADYNVTPVTLERDSLDGALPKGTDAVFIALHGGFGENGGVQAALDAKGIPYTGSGAAASRLAMDKILSKDAFLAANVPTPPYEVLGLGQSMTGLQLPLVVKPPRDGSSVGVCRIAEPKEWFPAIRQARRLDSRGEVLVEKFIPGREWTVSVVDGNALPVIEIQAPDGWYDYKAKYTTDLTQYAFPPESATTAKAQSLAVAAFKEFGCRGAARVDFRLTEENELFALEINTIPGFTPTSLLPKAALHAGISFVDLCDKLIDLAACDTVIAD